MRGASKGRRRIVSASSLLHAQPADRRRIRTARAGHSRRADIHRALQAGKWGGEAKTSAATRPLLQRCRRASRPRPASTAGCGLGFARCIELSKVQRLTNGCAWNAVSAFANCGRAVAHVRGSYVPDMVRESVRVSMRFAALTAASVRLRTPNARRSAAVWILVVPSAICKARAISLFVIPRTRSDSTCPWRKLSWRC
jgi:hypothetical protein